MTVSRPVEASIPIQLTPNRETADPFNFGTGVCGWFRAGTSFLAVLIMIVIGVQFIFMMYKPDLNDPDVWWHMRNAQYLFQHHQLPRQDTYSFTVVGHPWINHEWLSDIPFYLAYRAFGLIGVKSLSFFVLDA